MFEEVIVLVITNRKKEFLFVKPKNYGGKNKEGNYFDCLSFPIKRLEMGEDASLENAERFFLSVLPKEKAKLTNLLRQESDDFCLKKRQRFHFFRNERVEEEKKELKLEGNQFESVWWDVARKLKWRDSKC